MKSIYPILLLATLALTGCGNGASQPPQQGGPLKQAPPKVERVQYRMPNRDTRNALPHDIENDVTVIRDKSAWDELWAGANAPQVDFGKEMAVVLRFRTALTCRELTLPRVRVLVQSDDLEFSYAYPDSTGNGFAICMITNGEAAGIAVVPKVNGNVMINKVVTEGTPKDLTILHGWTKVNCEAEIRCLNY